MYFSHGQNNKPDDQEDEAKAMSFIIISYVE